MKSGIIRSIAVLSLGLLVTGCAVGRKISYHETQPVLSVSGTSQIAVAAQDNRPYVKNGEKTNNYVGNFRGGFGNPWDVTTASGQPLAEDMSSVICASFRKQGFSCKTVTVGPNESNVAVKLEKEHADKLLLLTINQWYSSTYQNTGLEYDLNLNVMNGSGRTLAEKKLQGDDNLGGSAWNPPAHAVEAVPQAYKSKLELLLNDPAVAKALK